MIAAIDTGRQPGGELTTEARLDALRWSLSQCATCGDVLMVEGAVKNWRRRLCSYDRDAAYAVRTMLEQRMSELSPRPRPGGSGANAESKQA